MKDNERQQNIVHFPGSLERLVEQGMEHFRSRELSEAIEKFKQALAWDETNEQASVGLLLTYTESGHVEEGIALALKMLQQDRADYFEVMQLYITLLMQQGSYEEVVSTLQAVQQETQYPADMAEYFFEMMELANRMMGEDFNQNLTEGSSEDEMLDPDDAVLPEETLLQLEQGEAPQQWQALSILKKYPSLEVKARLGHLLVQDELSPVIKTFILFLLRDWEVNEEVEVIKAEGTTKLVPANIGRLENAPWAEPVFTALQNHLEADNITLYEAASQIWYQALLKAFPFPPAEAEDDEWLAALHYEALTYYGDLPCFEDLTRKYDVDQIRVKDLLRVIHQLNEETGFPL
ncbi:hypothetical protein B0H94_10963 [Salsuginibacillus halophilus]|uniref:Uncharacterized protein n=1 Tax=Salsuginibacillus halophilus TaxID=517424 RepID=A0A2P8HCP8_9BACI|nr:hypothetical protein [Salsuginibacillus halophilus]PSL44006.1 hypothetical protein B0H94_10963 [Salsuginibacillus halophilus]